MRGVFVWFGHSHRCKNQLLTNLYAWTPHTVECIYAYRQMRAITISVCYLNSHKSVIFSEQKTLPLRSRHWSTRRCERCCFMVFWLWYHQARMAIQNNRQKPIAGSAAAHATIQQNHILCKFSCARCSQAHRLRNYHTLWWWSGVSHAYKCIHAVLAR